jgi:hypothetical protein
MAEIHTLKTRASDSMVVRDDLEVLRLVVPVADRLFRENFTSREVSLSPNHTIEMVIVSFLLSRT